MQDILARTPRPTHPVTLTPGDVTVPMTPRSVGLVARALRDGLVEPLQASVARSLLQSSVGDNTSPQGRVVCRHHYTLLQRYLPGAPGETQKAAADEALNILCAHPGAVLPPRVLKVLASVALLVDSNAYELLSTGLRHRQTAVVEWVAAVGGWCSIAEDTALTLRPWVAEWTAAAAAEASLLCTILRLAIHLPIAFPDTLMRHWLGDPRLPVALYRARVPINLRFTYLEAGFTRSPSSCHWRMLAAVWAIPHHPPPPITTTTLLDRYVHWVVCGNVCTTNHNNQRLQEVIDAAAPWPQDVLFRHVPVALVWPRCTTATATCLQRSMMLMVTTCHDDAHGRPRLSFSVVEEGDIPVGIISDPSSCLADPHRWATEYLRLVWPEWAAVLDKDVLENAGPPHSITLPCRRLCV